MFKKNTFGQYLIIKQAIMRTACFFTYYRFSVINSYKITGSEIFQKLPKQNVLIVSNHQTYFADAALLVHSMGNSINGAPNKITIKNFFWKPFLNFYYVAAKETMKSGLLPKIFALTGSISIERTWRSKGKDIQRDVNKDDTKNIEKALSDGWVLTFPQGTTTPFAPGRKGTAHIIKNYKPVVVPVVVDGMREAFGKKGLKIKKKGVDLILRIKQPLEIDYSDLVENILEQVMDAIEQSKKFEL